MDIVETDPALPLRSPPLSEEEKAAIAKRFPSAVVKGPKQVRRSKRLAKKKKKKKKKEKTFDPFAYDHTHPENYSIEDLEKIMEKIPATLQTLAKDTMAKMAEMDLYETAEEKLVVATEIIKLYDTKTGLLMTAGHISLDQCRKYKQKADEKEKLYDDLITIFRRKKEELKLKTEE
jgi:hypothetical protein